MAKTRRNFRKISLTLILTLLISMPILLSSPPPGWAQVFETVKDLWVNGNAGLGTTAPGARLDIKGSGTSGGFALRIADSLGVNNLVALDNGRVGIGTTNPQNELHVYNANGSAKVLVERGIAAASKGYLFASSGAFRVGSGNIVPLAFEINDVEKMRIDTAGNVGIGVFPSAKLDIRGSGTSGGFALRIADSTPTDRMVVLDNGNVGIGTTNPGAKLEVNGQLKITGGAPGISKVLTSDGSGLATWEFVPGGWSRNAPNVYLTVSSDNVGIGTSTPQARLDIVGAGFDTGPAMILRNSNLTPKVTFLDNGNIGIGVTDPAYQLDVVGDIHASSFFHGDVYPGYAAGGWVEGSSETRTRLTSFNVGVGIVTPDAKLHIVANDTGTGFALHIQDFNSADKVVILDNGSVGIGTTLPNEKLEVDGGIKLGNTTSSTDGIIRWTGVDFEGRKGGNWASLTAGGAGGGVPGGSLYQIQYNYPSGTFGGTPLMVSDGSNLSVGVGTTGNASRLYIKGAGTSTGIALRIADSTPTDRMVVLDNGNVGIGLTNPAYKLDLQGAGTAPVLRINGYILPGNTGTNGQVLKTDGSGNVTWQPASSGTPGGSVNQMQYNSPSGTFGGTPLIVSDGSNLSVGIGTTNNASRLYVKGAGTTSGFALRIADSQAADRLVVLDNGRVGIGVTNPSDALVHVRSADGTINLRLQNANTGGGDWYIGTSDNSQSVGGGGKFYLSPSNVTQQAAFVILQNGNIGIGYTSPQYTLHVAGTAATQTLRFGTNLNNILPAGTGTANQVLQTNGSGTISWASLGNGDIDTVGDCTSGDCFTGTQGTTLTFNVGVGETAPTISSAANGNLTVAAPSGTVILGSNTGNIDIALSNPADVLTVTKTSTLSATYNNNDFTFTRTFTGGSYTQAGAILKIIDSSTGTGNIKPDMLLINAANTNPSGSLLRLQAANADKVIITNAGNVGIATTNPIYALHVSGTAAAQTLRFGTNLNNILPAGTGANNQVLQANGTGTINWATLSNAGTPGGSVNQLQYNYPSGTFGGTPLIVSDGSNLSVGTGVTGNASRLFVKGAGSGTGMTLRLQAEDNYDTFVVLDYGNVGIGTTNPTEMLMVNNSYGTGTIAIRGVGNPEYTYLQLIDGNNNRIWEINHSFSMPNAFTLDYYDFITYGGWVNRMVILPSGNMGLGITSPLARLDIRGSGTTNNFALRIADSSAADKLVVLDKGYVGIGTTNPVYKLDLQGAGTAPIFRINGYILPGSTGSANQILKTDASGNVTWQVDSQGNANPGGSVNQMQYNSPSGTFGGTPLIVSDGSSLSVGTGATGNASRLYIKGAGTGTGITLRIANSTPSDNMVVLDNGNVGIGTTDPIAALHVAGNITSPGSGTDSERFGNNSTTGSSSYSVAVGSGASASVDSSVAIGRNASVDAIQGGVAIGNGAYATQQESIAIGSSANASGTRSMAIGNNAQNSGNDSVAIGYGVTGAHSGVTIGANASGVLGSVVLGLSAASTDANQFIAGSETYPTNNVFFGKGAESAAPTEYSIHGTGGTGVNITGGRLIIAGGQGTGSGAGGEIYFQTAPAGAGGSAQNYLEDRVVIDSNGNVGIATTNPQYKLHVSGTAASQTLRFGTNLDNILPAGTGTANQVLIAQGNGVINWGTAGAGSGTPGGQVNQIQYQFPSGTFAGAGLIVTDGNNLTVGIGTTANNSRLYVRGAGTGTGIALRIADSTPTDRMVVLDNGNVGIGLTNPSYKLDLQGAGTAPIFRINGYILPGATGAANQILKTDASGNVTWQVDSQGNANPGGSVNQIQFNSPSGTFGGTPLIVSDGSNLSVGIGTTANNSRLYVRGAGTGTGITLRIANSTPTDILAVLDNGNVGIGLTNPSEKLEVTGNIKTSGTGTFTNLRFGNAATLNILPATTGTNGQVLKTNATGTITWQSDLNTGTPGGSVNQMQYNSPSGTFGGTPLIVTDGNNLTVGIGTTANNSRLYVRGAGTGTGIALRIADSTPADRMVVLDNGNVGIGLTNPSYKLDLQGAGTAPIFRINGYILPGATGAANQILKTDASGNVTWQVDSQGNANPGGSVNQMQYNSPSGTFGGTPLIVSDGSNLSVGTGATGNVSRLYIKGGGTTAGFALRIANSNAADKLVVLDNGNVGIGITGPLGLLHVSTGPYTSLMVTTDGRVGIGTSSPSAGYYLTLIAPAKFLGANVITLSSLGNGFDGGYIDGEGGYLKLQSVATSSVRFVNNNNATITTVDNDTGNVGIGVGMTSPIAKLDIKGSGTGTGFSLRISDSSAADKLVVLDNGNVGIGTTLPSSILHIANGGILATGTSGTTPVSGAGTRLMWIPAKAAFRAGSVTSTEWDDANIGDNSVALGYRNSAAGYASFAAGAFNTAGHGSSDAYSIAIGDGNDVQGGYSAVGIGDYNTVNGAGAKAFGNNNTATGADSIAIGYNATAASPGANPAFAFGQNVEANGTQSMVIGVGAGSGLTNSTNQSLAIGFNSTVPTVFVGPSSGAGTFGNVGIATTNPSYRLQVSGTAAAQTLRFGTALDNILPAGTGTANQVLVAQGNGTINWGAAGGGDNISVNGTAATDANFVNTSASGTMPSITWNLNATPTPNEISISSIGAASASEAGIITTGTQTVAGDKTVSGTLRVTGNSGFGSDGVVGIFTLDASRTGTLTSGGEVNLGGYLYADPSSASSTSYRGLQMVAKVKTGNAQNFTSDMYGGWAEAEHDGTGTLAQAIGLYGQAEVKNTGPITDAYGVIGSVHRAGTGNISNAYGVYGQVYTENTGTVSKAYALYASNPLLSSGTVTDNYGVYIENQTSGSSNNYALFSVGGTNYFGGSVGIGASTPSYTLHVAGTAAAQTLRFGTALDNILPAGTGTANQVLVAQGNGVINWGSAGGGSGTPGTPVNSLQYNYPSGTFAGAGLMVTDGSNLSIGTGSTNNNSRLYIKGAGTTAGFALRIADSSSADKLVVLDNGNVGIGTTNPQEKLDIAGNIRTSGSLRLTGGASFPGSPAEGDVYFRTDLKQLYVYANGKWQADRTTATKIVAASDSQNKEKADYVCDGTDDEVQINQAISALPATGGLVCLLDGTYTVNAQTLVSGTAYYAIGITSNSVTLTGAGDNSIVKMKDSWGTNTAYMLYVGSSKNNVKIQDIKIDGNRTNQSAGTIHGVYFDTVNYSLISGITVASVRNAGLRLYSSASNRIANCMIQDALGGAFQLLNSDNNTLTGNTINDQTAESLLRDSKQNALSGNVFNNNLGTYTTVDFGGTTPGSTLNIFDGNEINGGNGRGIVLNGSSNSNVVSNNSIRGMTYGAVEIYSDFNTLTGNSIAQNSRVAFWVSGGQYNTISSNSLYDNTGSGSDSTIYITGAGNNLISSNRIYDTAGSGYAIQLTGTANNTVLVGNYYSGTGANTISDSGVNTRYLQPETIRLRTMGSGTNFALRITNTVPTDLLAVLDNGNVGINYTNPQYTLHVAGTAAAQTLRFGTALDNILPAGTGTANQVLVAQGNGIINWGSAGGGSGTPGTPVNSIQYNYPSGTFAGASLLVTDGSNLTVGIGTTNNNSRLYVRGAGTGTGITLRIADSTPTDRMVVLDNGNVGIGLTNPSEKLEVSGNIKASGTGTFTNLRFGNTTTLNILPAGTGTSGQILKADGTGGVSWSADNNTGTPGGSVNQIQFNFPSGTFGGTPLLVSDGSNLTVGIGTTNNNSRLYVRGAGTGTGIALRIADSTPTDRMVVLDNGNVGIGLTNPSEKLEVSGNIKASGTGTFTNLRFGNATTLNILPAGTGSTGQALIASAGGSIIWANTSAGGGCTPGGSVNQMQYQYPAGTLAGAGLIVTDGSSLTVGIGTTNSNTRLYVRGAGTTAGFALRIADSTPTDRMVVLDNGNVGIATTAPGYKLEVAGSVKLGSGSGNINIALSNPADVLNVTKTTTLAATYNTTDFTFKRTLTGSTYTQAGAILQVIDQSTGTGNITPDVVIITGTTSANSNLLRLQSGSTDRIVVNNAGNVGIGTTNPAYKVDLQSGSTAPAFRINGYILPGSTGSVNQILKTDASGNVTWQADAGVGSTPGGSVNQLQFNYPSGTFGGTPLIVSDGSNLTVGIGTTSNNSRLYVRGAGTGTGIALRIADSTPADRMVVLDNGNVGIGLTNPSYKLDLQGAGTAPIFRINGYILPGNTGTNNQVLKTDGSGNVTWGPAGGGSCSMEGTINGMLFLSAANTGTGSSLIVTDGSNLSIGTGTTGNNARLLVKGSGAGAGMAIRLQDSNGADKYVVLDNGNIGVGTTNPGEKIEISGNVKLTGIIKQGGLGDLAEMMPVAGCVLNSAKIKSDPILLKPEPADVVIIDEDGGIRRSFEPFATNVVGIISTSPAQILRDGLKDAVPVVLSGIVPCKVTSENGMIKPGDMLVASSMPGYAMRAGKNPPLGTVIGKALTKLEKDKGTVDVLVMLK